MPEAERIARDGGPPWPSRQARLIAPVVFSLLVQVPAAIWVPLRSEHPEPWRIALHIALAVAGPLTLLAARRMPGPTVAAVSAFALADLLFAPFAGPPFVALAFAIVSAMARGAAVWAAASVAAGWTTAVLVMSFGGREWHPPQIVLATLALAACFAAGAVIRVRSTRFAERRAESARLRQSAEERERVRIARELHDVLGHALSQITVQAGVGLHLFDRDPEQARAALANVKETSKTALDEVRAVLGVLREGEAPLVPQPGLADLPALVAGARGPGHDVTLDDRLDGAAPDRATQFAAYRIVQEALTNAIRHSGARRVRVRLERLTSADGALRVTVEDDGRGFGAADPADPADAGRRGILGMRERAALLGGTVQVGDGEGGGARIAAVLPWGRTA